MEGHMTGRSVRTLIPERRLAGGILASIITPALLVLSFVKVIVRKVMHVSTRTAYSSVGFTLLAIVRSLVRTGPTAAGACASLLIRRSNSVFSLRTVHEAMLSRLTRSTGLRVDSDLNRSRRLRRLTRLR